MNYSRKYGTSEPLICSLTHNEDRLYRQANAIPQGKLGYHPHSDISLLDLSGLYPVLLCSLPLEDSFA
jgi:hypothetical protein